MKILKFVADATQKQFVVTVEEFKSSRLLERWELRDSAP